MSKKKIAMWLFRHLPFDWVPIWVNNQLAKFAWRTYENRPD